MATTKDGPNATDFIVTSLSPILIMGLIGSLVFFLVEIFYAGKYEGRLLWTLFFFVFGMVLVTRVAIQVDSARAIMYGLMLAGVSWLALMAFVDYPRDSAMAPFAPVINLVLIAVVWWCANKLTWDCTYIDEARTASSRGLLSAAGMEQRPGEAPPEPVEPRRDRKGTFWDRYARFRERRAKRPHTPGTTVVYFSLAALPIFGLGQSLVPSSDAARRSLTFSLAVGYVGSGLGLLLTTSFLGLRRYLRQRDVKMPAVMTGTWLGLGTALIVGFLVVAAFLPRPYSETPILGLNRVGSADRNASKNAVLRDGTPGKGEGRTGSKTTPGDGDATSKGGQPGGKGKSDGEEGSGGDKEKGDGGDRKNGKEGKGDDPGEKNDSKRGSEIRNDQSEPQNAQNGSERGERRMPETRLGGVLEKIASFLKWVVFIILGLAVLFLIFRYGLQYLSNFTDWAKNWLALINGWWDRLFGQRGKPTTPNGTGKPVPVARRPFHSFSNPFTDGTAEQRPIEELIAYSFAALEAWAGDRNHAREPHETALEFTSRLSAEFPSLGNDAHRLAVLVARLAYAQGLIPKDALPSLEQFWETVTSLMPEPVAA